MRSYYQHAQQHLAKIATAAGAVLLFIVAVRWLGLVTSDVAARTLSYGLLPMVCLGCGALARDGAGIKSALLITVVWCVNTVVFYFDNTVIVHTAFMDLACISALIYWQRPLVAGFSGAMVPVSILILFGFQARLVLDMLFLGQCVLLAMQNVPELKHTNGAVVELHGSPEKITHKASY